MPFKITVLGSNSATPINNRHPSAQILQLNERFFLIDCGEGTQMQLLRYKINWNKIEHIFISHLHGDHYLGLMGLLFTMALLGRKSLLKVYAPVGLLEIVTIQFYVSKTVLEFELQILGLKSEGMETVFEDENVTVKTFPLIHGVTCYGFRLEEKQGQ